METIHGDARNPGTLYKGGIGGAAYDTAWAARVTDDMGTPLFPECVQWLLEHQKKDGSWGGHILNYHDRLLSTLSAVIALQEIDRNRYSPYITKGETYIWETVKNLESDSTRLIGSELLVPSLMEEAESLQVNLPYHIKVYKKEYTLKLEKIEESLWYSPLTTLSFSLEFLGEHVDKNRLAHVQLQNGSVATSPAATAFFLRHKKDEKAFQYLREVLSLTGNGSMMTVYPVDVFAYGWTLYNLMLAGLYLNQYGEICDFLAAHMGPSGVGSSVELPLTEADDTAVVCKNLYTMGYPVDGGVFDAYDTGEYYMTFPFELDPSVSTNVHVLDFVQTCSEFPQREEVIDRLVHFLKNNIRSPGFWQDKWHTSPYYPTSHAVFALCDADPSLAEKAVSWILATQHEDSTWGYNGGTLEETAYAVQALLYYHQKVDRLDISGLLESLSYTDRVAMFPFHRFCELWVGKVLYTPLDVVFSSMVSASTMYNTTVWNLSSRWSV
jgi:halimadienyl-diphosphate synthase